MTPPPLDNGAVARRASSPVFIGRKGQIDQILAALRRAQEGDPAFILISGEAGVGKTRFVEEVATHAAQLGVRSLVGGCIQLGDDTLPYAPIVEALRRLADTVTPPELARFVGPSSAELIRLVPDLMPPVRSEEQTGESVTSNQGRLLEAIVGLIGRLAADRPLILIIEDIHWADASTIALLGYLARNLRGATALVATYRSDELHRRHPLLPFLAELERRRRIDRIELLPFDRREIAELVGAIRSGSSDRELIDQLYRRSDGNAFFVEELLATGAAAGTLPTALRDVLSARIAALTEPTQELLRAASAAGPYISATLLRDVSSLDDADLQGQLREAVERQILTTLVGSSTLSFRHALMREAIYDSLLPWERIRLHAAFAAAFEASPAVGDDPSRAAELAYHWFAANDLPRALAAALRAAEAFDRIFAPADAHAQYERVLALWDQVPDAAERTEAKRGDVLERAAAVAAATAPGRAVAFIEAAIALIDPAVTTTKAGQLWELLGRYLWASGDGGAAVQACRTAVDLVPVAPPSAARAQALSSLGRVLMTGARFGEAKPILEEAIDLAGIVGADAAKGHGLNSLGVVLGYLGDIASGREKLVTAREIAVRLANADEVARADANLIDLVVHVAARFDEGAALAREAFGYARDHHLAHLYGVYDLCEGAGGLIRAGRWAEADELLDLANGYETAGISEIFLNERLALLEVWRGRHEDAAKRIALLRRVMDDPDIQWTLPLMELGAELALWQGRPLEARREIAEGFARLGDIDAGNISRIGPVIALAIRAEADQADVARSRRSERELGEVKELAERYVGLIRAICQEVVGERPSQVPLANAYLVACEAEMSRLEGTPSPGLWSDAAAGFAVLSMRYQQAYARWREADARLVERGPREAATDALIEAHEIAVRLGAEPLLREIETTARQARIALSKLDTANPPKPAIAFGLSARELDVLELLVAGRTNREIGDQLFISESTAGVHVSHILGKLGVTRRTEAAAIAHRLALFDPGNG